MVDRLYEKLSWRKIILTNLTYSFFSRSEKDIVKQFVKNNKEYISMTIFNRILVIKIK